MLIYPGQTGVVANFTYTVGSILSTADTASAIVLRNGIDTVVPVVLTTASTGRYKATFDIPATWVGYDRVDVRFEATTGGMVIECTKPLAVIGAAGLDDQQEVNIDRVLDLLEADEVITGGKAYKLLRGTTIVLLEKDITGSTCADDVSLTQ